MRARRDRNARTPTQMAYSTTSVGIATATYSRKVIALVPLFRSSLSPQWRRMDDRDRSPWVGTASGLRAEPSGASTTRPLAQRHKGPQRRLFLTSRTRPHSCQHPGRVETTSRTVMRPADASISGKCLPSFPLRPDVSAGRPPPLRMCFPALLVCASRHDPPVTRVTSSPPRRPAVNCPRLWNRFPTRSGRRAPASRVRRNRVHDLENGHEARTPTINPRTVDKNRPTTR